MEPATLELLVDQDQTGLIPHQALQLIAAFRAKQIDSAAVGVVTQTLAEPKRTAVR